MIEPLTAPSKLKMSNQITSIETGFVFDSDRSFPFRKKQLFPSSCSSLFMQFNRAFKWSNRGIENAEDFKHERKDIAVTVAMNSERHLQIGSA